MNMMTTVFLLAFLCGIVQAADPVPAVVDLKPAVDGKVVNTSVVNNTSNVETDAVQSVKQSDIKLPKQKIETVLVAEAVVNPKATTPKSGAFTASTISLTLILLVLAVSALPSIHRLQ